MEGWIAHCLTHCELINNHFNSTGIFVFGHFDRHHNHRISPTKGKIIYHHLQRAPYKANTVLALRKYLLKTKKLEKMKCGRSLVISNTTIIPHELQLIFAVSFVNLNFAPKYILTIPLQL